METLIELIFADAFGSIFLLFGFPLVLLTAAAIGFVMYFDYKQKQDFILSGIAEIDRMSGHDFEEYLKELFTQLSFDVRVVGGRGGDYGADLVLTHNRRKMVIQAKRYTKQVGNKAVQEVLGAKGVYNARDAMVITNNYFTKAAWVQAKGGKVILWDRDRLMKVIVGMKKGMSSEEIFQSRWLVPR